MRGRRCGAGRCFIGLCALAAGALPQATHAAPCTAALGKPSATAGPLALEGRAPVTAELTLTAGHRWLIEVREQGNDASAEILGGADQVLAHTDNPQMRTGTQRAVVTAEAAPLKIRVAGAEQTSGVARVRAFDLETLKGLPACLAVFSSLAAADTDFGSAQEISTGRAHPSSVSALALYQKASDEYQSAERALEDPSDRALRGETELYVAWTAYTGLQDWVKCAQWATVAAKTLAPVDPYRRALADALLAAALIEIGNAANGGRHLQGFDQPPAELLARARTILASLSRFHLQRGERYDAGLQLNNIALTYLYSGRYADCAEAARTAGRVFGTIHELQRTAVASENRALCLWGLGRLPEAVALLESAIPVLSTDPIPILYLGVLNNTALIHYALGHFDRSLQLFDRSLALAQQGQWRRDEGQALYGIGRTYYALGDRDRAQQFLERSRTMRLESSDARGRMQTARALATVYADQGRLTDALATDREALGLAVAPATLAHIKIQMATHTAAAGRPREALDELGALLAADATGDTLIRAEAALQRARVLRQTGHPAEALRDLAAARRGLRAGGSVMERFQLEMEFARDRRELAEPREALAAVDQALSWSGAVRTQSANPELRAQLQTPLRAAYDLKLDILRSQYDLAVMQGRRREAQSLATSAFLTADSSRAQTLADVGAQKYPPALRATLVREFRRREALYLELAGRRFALDARLDSSGSGDPRSQHLMQDIAELERQLDTINSAIASRTLPDKVHVRGGERSGLPQVPDDTVLVSYWLGSDYAYAWVVARHGIEWVQLAAPGLIAQRSAALQRSLTRLIDVPLEARLENARALYALVIQPLEPWLNGARQWIMVPDGGLDYVPFAALHARGDAASGYVVVRHDVAVTPAAWMLEARSGQGAPSDVHGILLVADPVYESADPRLAPRKLTAVSRGRDSTDPARRDYARLPYTAVEARAIASQFAPTEVRELTGVEATRDKLLAVDWSRFRYIHIATHGIVDAEVPQLSALILGTYDASGEVSDRAVRVADLALQSLNADVVAFSACDTALGRQTASEGLLGLGTITLARGARAVLASLWPVSDEMGARVMTDFYRHLLHDEASAPAALGAAMRTAIAHDRVADPALWAAFQVSVATLGDGQQIRTPGRGPLTTPYMPQEQP